MKISFYKYHAAGNDFIIIDNRRQMINHQNPALLSGLCDRRFGIGADGIMFLQQHAGFDFEMIYYNADGQPSSMCGNGGRCIVAFARHLQLIKDKTHFLANDGPHSAAVNEKGDWVSLQMNNVESIRKIGDAYTLDTGSPHYVQLINGGLSEMNVYQEGREIRQSTPFADKGINVNFVEETESGYVIRTYERGVENETFACGTGATAVALAMAVHTGKSGHITTMIKALGGNMRVSFDYNGAQFFNINLEGPAIRVFSAEILFPIPENTYSMAKKTN